MSKPKKPNPILLIGNVDPRLWRGLPTQIVEVGIITLNHILPKVVEKGVCVISICDPADQVATSALLSFLEKRVKGRPPIIPELTIPCGQELAVGKDNWNICEILAIKPVEVGAGAFHYRLTFPKSESNPRSEWFANLGFR